MKKIGFVIISSIVLFLLFSLLVCAESDGYETDGICNGNVYSIVRDGSPVAAFDVDNGAISAGTHVSLYQYYPENPWQRWRFIYLGNGEYKIKDEHSNKFLTVENNSTADGAYMCIYIGSNWDGQIFSIVKNSDGTYAILTKSSNYQMAVTADASGGAIKQQTYTGQSYQHYRLTLSGYIYQFQFESVNKVMSITENGNFLNTDVVQYERYPGSRHQQWLPFYVGNGDYFIRNMHTGLWLTSAGSNANDNIYTSLLTGTDNQLFRIVQNNDGTYTFLSKLSNYTMAIGASEWSYNNVSIAQTACVGTSYTSDQRLQALIDGDREIPKGIYYFQCANTAKYAQVDDGNSTHLEQHGHNGTSKQQWRVEYVRDNVYKIINVNTDMALTAPTSLSSGQNLYTADYTGSTQQEWYFTLLSTGNYEIRCNYWKLQGNTTLVMAVGSAILNLNLDGTNIRQENRGSTSRGEWNVMGGYGLSMLTTEEFEDPASARSIDQRFKNGGCYNTYSNYSAYESGFTVDKLKIHISTSKYMLVSSHGSPTSIQCQSNPNVFLTRNDVISLPSDILFSNCRLIVLSACECGYGGPGGQNIAQAIRNKGAKSVVAFKTEIPSNPNTSDMWNRLFFQYYVNGDNISTAMGRATNYFQGTSAYDAFNSGECFGVNGYFS